MNPLLVCSLGMEEQGFPLLCPGGYPCPGIRPLGCTLPRLGNSLAFTCFLKAGMFILLWVSQMPLPASPGCSLASPLPPPSLLPGSPSPASFPQGSRSTAGEPGRGSGLGG